MELRIYCDYFARFCRMIKGGKNYKYELIITPYQYELRVHTSYNLEYFVFQIKEIQVDTDFDTVLINLDYKVIQTIGSLLIKNCTEDIIILANDDKLENVDTLITYGGLEFIVSSVRKTYGDSIEESYTEIDKPDIKLLGDIVSLIKDTDKNPIDVFWFDSTNVCNCIGWSEDLSSAYFLTKCTAVMSVIDYQFICIAPIFLKSMLSTIKYLYDYFYVLDYDRQLKLEIPCYFKVLKEQVPYTVFFINHKVILEPHRQTVQTLLDLDKKVREEGRRIKLDKEKLATSLDKAKTLKADEFISLNINSKLKVEDYLKLFNSYPDIQEIRLMDNMLLLSLSDIDVLTTLYKPYQAANKDDDRD